MAEAVSSYQNDPAILIDLARKSMPELCDIFFGPLRETVYSDTALDEKTKRLMALGMAIQANCKLCMGSHTGRALELGATLPEIFETCALAISLGGTFAMTNTLSVFEYLKEQELIS